MSEMLKNVKTNCPTYADLYMENGHISKINGKELDAEGVENVIAYLGREVDVTVEHFMDTVNSKGMQDGEMHVKMHNGAVSFV